jgi:peptidoglycan/xylan/chitin deacetylase (PgdA/CDA1 family)
MEPLVLCYHAISSEWECSLAMPEEAFARQIGTLERRGYVGLTVTEAEQRRRAGTLPQRALVVTFDDAYASTLRAKPILDAAGYPATVFAVTSFADSLEPLSWPGIEQWRDGPHAQELRPLGWTELGHLAAGGWEIGSHTVCHARLPDLDDAALRDELVVSREQIIARFGSCATIAYPYGLADERVAREAAAAGYLTGLTLTSAHQRDEPLLRPRTGLYPSDRWRERVKLSPWFGVVRRSRIGGSIVQALARD